MFDELKPCPFCGGKAHLFVSEGVRVLCPKCGATTKILVDGITAHRVEGNAVKAVIEAWNKRVEVGGCVGEACELKKPTNADHIRSMSDEELAAEFMIFRPSDKCFDVDDKNRNYISLNNRYFVYSQDCFKENLHWLKQSWQRGNEMEQMRT